MLWVVNRSSIPEAVTLDVTGDWRLAPLGFTLPAGERQAVKVTPGSADGAVTVRVTSAEPPEPGAERGVLVLGTQLLVKSPPSVPWGVLLIAVMLALVIGWRIVRPPGR